MNRNNGVYIAIELLALREFLYRNADQTHAVNVEVSALLECTKKQRVPFGALCLFMVETA